MRISIIVFLSLPFLGGAVFAEKAIPPSPRSYIYDEPHLLSASGSQVISQYLSEEDRKTGNQVLVAIFNSTNGEDPVDYTNRLFKAWNPGQKGKDNGVILAIYLKEKRTRIEVGYGLEPILTDAKSSRVLNNVLKPAFQQQAFDQGIEASVKTIHQLIADPNAEPPTQREPSGSNRTSPWIVILLFGGVFGFLYLYDRFYQNTYTLSSGHRGRRRSPWDGGYGGGFGGGSSSGGGGGFGGFSGGGGSSGGGGASGSW